MRDGKQFKSWKLEVQRILYEANHGTFNISQVEESEDYWEQKYLDNCTPQEAIQLAIDDAIDCQ